jgi:hypothetical protein
MLEKEDIISSFSSIFDDVLVANIRELAIQGINYLVCIPKPNLDSLPFIWCHCNRQMESPFLVNSLKVFMVDS